MKKFNVYVNALVEYSQEVESEDQDTAEEIALSSLGDMKIINLDVDVEEINDD